MASVGGIISGIDTNSIVTQLMNAARGPIRGFQGRISSLETRKSKLQEMNTLLSDFKTALDAVNSSEELPAYAVSSSQPNQLGATVSEDGWPATYDVQVISAADASILRSNGYATSTSEIRAGTLKITTIDGTTNVPLSDVDGTRTLDGLAEYINDNVDGVYAYVLNTGVPGSPYKLMLQGEETGAAHDVSATVTAGGGPGTPLTMTSQQVAADAELLVDGQTVFTESNQAAGVIPGVTLDIKGVTTGEAQISVGQDTSKMVGNVQAVVDAYNKLNAFFGKNIGLEADSAIQGDQTVRTVQRRVQQVMSAGYSSGDVAGINSLGLGTSQDGTLNFDSAVFSAKLGTDFQDAILTLTDGGLFDDLYDAVDAVVDPVTGILAPRLSSIDSQVKSLNDSIADTEYRLEKMESRLRQQFTAMESAMAKYQATGDFLAAQLASLSNS